MQSRIYTASQSKSVLPEGFDIKQVFNLVGEVVTGFFFLGWMFMLPALLRGFWL